MNMTPDTDSSGTRRRFLKHVGAGAAMASLAGCTGGGGGGGGGSDETLKIGGLFPTSGPYSTIGVDQRDGMEAALDRIEAEEVDVEIETVVKDTQLDPQEGLRRAKELINRENVDVLTGIGSSSVASAVSNEAKKNSTPLMLTTATDEALTAGKCNRYTFRTNTHTYQNMKPVAEWAMENLGTTFATMGADYSWGRASVGAFVEVAEENGGEVVEQTWPKLGATDYSSQIQKVANTDADFLVLRTSGADAVNSIKQIDSFGLKEQMDVISNQTTNAARGTGDAMLGNYGAFPYHFTLENEANQQFLEAYEQNSDDAFPSTFSNTSYVGVRMLAKAAVQAGSTSAEDLVNTLEGLSFDGPKGVMKLRECDHQSTNAMWISQSVESDEYDFPVPEIIQKSEPGSNDRPCDETGCNMDGEPDGEE